MQDSIDDLFFAGIHDWEKASMLIVTSRLDGVTYRVKDASSFDEPNGWQTAFRECLQGDRSQP